MSNTKNIETKKIEGDPKAMGEINSLMLFVHNKTAQDIASLIGQEVIAMRNVPLDITLEGAYTLGLTVAKEIAAAQIKDSITLK